MLLEHPQESELQTSTKKANCFLAIRVDARIE